MFAFFLTFRHDDPARRATVDEISRFIAVLRHAPGLARALVFTPEAADDPYLNDGPCPPLAAELYFDSIAALEAALARNGELQALAAPDLLPGLTGAEVTQQAMLARPFPVPQPAPPDAPGCTYLVSYDGVAEDENLWLSHYLDHHPPIMARFPGIRAIEICTRIDWCGFLPWPRVSYLQRNKVVFDSPAALTAALQSPVRHEMRADFHKLPPFTGTVRHYPMATRSV